MIIPKEYGGLGFSAKAQSMVLQKLSANETLMVTVGVPNSLGPGELLLKYGTQEQKITTCRAYPMAVKSPALA